jgi:hypothetical protein
MSRTPPQATQEIQDQRSTKRNDDTSFQGRRASGEHVPSRPNRYLSRSPREPVRCSSSIGPGQSQSALR